MGMIEMVLKEERGPSPQCLLSYYYYKYSLIYKKKKIIHQSFFMYKERFI